MRRLNTSLLVVSAVLLGAISIVSAQTQDEAKSVLQLDGAAQPAVQSPSLPTLGTPQLQPALELNAPQDVWQPTMVAPLPLVAASSNHGCCCTDCGRSGSQRRRRCCPPPIPTDFCLVDPCGCTHEACIKIPACCCGQTPCIKWQKGALGRQIATLCWDCCDFEAKVIVTRKGKVRVRD